MIMNIKKNKKSFLTIKQKKERLNWCLAHSNWIVNDWRRAIFSDETTFYVKIKLKYGVLKTNNGKKVVWE